MGELLRRVHVLEACLTAPTSEHGERPPDLRPRGKGARGRASAIVALTAQNTLGVTAVQELPAEFVEEELEAVWSDIGVDAA